MAASHFPELLSPAKHNYNAPMFKRRCGGLGPTGETPGGEVPIHLLIFANGGECSLGYAAGRARMELYQFC